MENPQVGIIMGSTSDLPVMREAAEILKTLGVAYEVEIVSAHRTPDKMRDYGKKARERGLQCIIAGAGGAAHLPGMTASFTTLPVIGVPVKSHNSIEGIDSLLSIVQMPGGIPVATVAINGAKNAGILAASIVANTDESVAQKLAQFKIDMEAKVLKAGSEIGEI